MRHSLSLSLVGALSVVGARYASAQPDYDQGYDGSNEQQSYGRDDGSYDGNYDNTYANDEYRNYDSEGYDGSAYREDYGRDDDYSASTGVARADTFYDRLSPYGRWIRTPEYGLVWVPYRNVVGADFQPYASAGAWNYSDAGWMFVSDYDWGWAPFHYGRWYFDIRYGWTWVPGRVWAPAWVDWRFGGGYIGWAPLPPRVRYVNIYDRRTRWCFTPARYINRPYVQRYLVRPERRLFAVATPVRRPYRLGRASWYAGPRVDLVERAGGVRLNRVRIAPPRPGVVARIRVEGDRVRQERIAPPRRLMTAPRAQLERPRVGPDQRRVGPAARQVAPAPEPRRVMPEPRRVAPEEQPRVAPQPRVMPEPRRVMPEPRRVAPEPRQVIREPRLEPRRMGPEPRRDFGVQQPGPEPRRQFAPQGRPESSRRGEAGPRRAGRPDLPARAQAARQGPRAAPPTAARGRERRRGHRPD